MGVNPKIGGKTSKMDGLFHGNPYEQMDDLGGFPPIFGLTPNLFFHLVQRIPWDLWLFGILEISGVGLVQGEITPGNSLSCLVFGWI